MTQLVSGATVYQRLIPSRLPSFLCSVERSQLKFCRAFHRSFANSLSPWKKGTARLFVSEGGSDPTKLLGGLAAEKWGRSRPFQSFFHGDLSLHFVPYLLRVQEIARATG